MQKLSRSKIELFIDCPRCFWLDAVHTIKRPPGFPYTLNNAVDYLLKQEFDIYREAGKPHPIMIRNGVDAIPFKTPEIDKWRHNFTGVQCKDEANGFLITGAVDDVWVNPQKELMVVDYKATGAREHKIYDSYKRQMEIYQWLLRQNKYAVSRTGYFVFARVNKTNGFSPEEGEGGGRVPSLSFDIFVEPQEGDDAWIPGTLGDIRATRDSAVPPQASESCVYCAYRGEAAALSTKQI